MVCKTKTRDELYDQFLKAVLNNHAHGFNQKVYYNNAIVAEIDNYQIAGTVSTVNRRLAVVGVTDNWRVEVNGDITGYTHDQAVCIAGLLTVMDTSLTIAGVRDVIRDYFSGREQPEVRVADYEPRKLETLLGRISNVVSPIQGNYFRLGKNPAKMTALMSGLEDESYAKLKRYFNAHPEYAHLAHTALGTYATQRMDRQVKAGTRDGTLPPDCGFVTASKVSDFAGLIDPTKVPALLLGI